MDGGLDISLHHISDLGCGFNDTSLFGAWKFDKYVPKVDKTAKLATCTPDDFERFNVSFRVLKSRAFPEGCPTEISEFHRGAAISVLETITSNLKLILNTQTQNLAEGIKSSARRMLSMSISSTILS